MHHNLDMQNEVNAKLVEVLKRSFYVVDFVFGASGDEMALNVALNA